MIRVDRHELGPRVYLGGRRVHHGTAGLTAAALCLVAKKNKAGALALAVALHDIRDFPFRDTDNH